MDTTRDVTITSVQRKFGGNRSFFKFCADGDNHLARINILFQTVMNTEIQAYINKQTTVDKEICDLLATTFYSELTEAESKIWYAHPVWFINGNPIVGYSKQKAGWRLMFWSGADFEEEKLNVIGKKYKDASVFYTTAEKIDTNDLKRWLIKSREIQYDYKNIVIRKGRLERL